MALRRSSATLTPGLPNGSRAAYALLRGELTSHLELIAAQLKSTQQALIDQCGSLAAALLSTHALRCYSPLLGEAVLGSQRNTQQARCLLAEVKHVLSLSAAYYGTDHDDSTYWRDLPSELRASGLLEFWARDLLLLAAAEGGEGDAAELLWGTACHLRRIWDYTWNLKTRNVFASPSLSYLLSSHLVGLCAALDGGTTYGMPAAPGAAVAPLFDTNGRPLRPLAHVGPDLALMTLHMWTTWMATAQKTLQKARSHVADAYSSCGGSGGDGTAVPPARRARMPSLQQALRACLQQCEQRLAALRSAVQGAGEAAGASGAQHAPSPRPPSGAPQPAGPASQQPEGVAAARAPVDGEEEPAASPQDRSSAQEKRTISSPEASQQPPCDTLADKIVRCEKDARRIRELLSGAPLPPLNAAAAFDISMRLAASCVRALQRAAAAAPAAGASDGETRSAAAALSAHVLDAGQQQQDAGQAGPLLRAADALTVATRALGCARAVCAEVSELPYSQARATPRVLQRLRRIWTTKLTLGTAADSAGLLADAYTFRHVAGFARHDGAYHMHCAGFPPLEPCAEAVVAVEAGVMPFAERALRRAADPQCLVRALFLGPCSYGNWAQALSLSPPRQSASLLPSLAKVLRQAAAEVLQAALAAKAEQAWAAARGGPAGGAAAQAAKGLCLDLVRTVWGVSDLLRAVLALFRVFACRDVGACAKPRGSQAECSAGAAVSSGGRAPGVVVGGGALGSQPCARAVEHNADDNAGGGDSGSSCSSGDAAGRQGAVTGPALAMSLAATHLMPAMCLLLRRLRACDHNHLKPDIVAALLSAVPVLAAAATPDAAPPFALQGEAGHAAVGSLCPQTRSGTGQPSHAGDARTGSGNDTPAGQGCVDRYGGAGPQRSSCRVSVDADTAIEWRRFLVRDLDLPWLLQEAVGLAVGGNDARRYEDVPGLRLCLAPALWAVVRCMPDELAAMLMGRGAEAVAKAAFTGGQQPSEGPPALSQLRALLGPGGAMADSELLAAVEDACGGAGGGPSMEANTLPGEVAQWAAAAALLIPPSAVRAALPVCSNPLCTNLEGDSEAALRLRGCAGCGEVARYCSRSCQVAHWRAGHSKECAGRGATAAASAVLAE